MQEQIKQTMRSLRMEGMTTLWEKLYRFGLEKSCLPARIQSLLLQHKQTLSTV